MFDYDPETLPVELILKIFGAWFFFHIIKFGFLKNQYIYLGFHVIHKNIKSFETYC